jgi:hypothetical protein
LFQIFEELFVTLSVKNFFVKNYFVNNFFILTLFCIGFTLDGAAFGAASLRSPRVYWPVLALLAC